MVSVIVSRIRFWLSYLQIGAMQIIKHVHSTLFATFVQSVDTVDLDFFVCFIDLDLTSIWVRQNRVTMFADVATAEERC